MVIVWSRYAAEFVVRRLKAVLFAAMYFAGTDVQNELLVTILAGLVKPEKTFADWPPSDSP